MTHHHDLTTAYQSALLAGTSPITRRAYTRDVRYFWAWLYRTGQRTHRTPSYPVPLNTVLRFILDHAGQMDPVIETQLIEDGLRTKRGALKISTIRRYLASLSVAHVEHGTETPIQSSQVRLLLRRLQRAQAHQRPYKKEALTLDRLLLLLATCDDSLHGIRDKAILLVGFASGGRRRSELANLYAEDLRKVEGGYIIRVRQSKTDQAGLGHETPSWAKRRAPSPAGW